jgi:hypothetical protein
MSNVVFGNAEQKTHSQIARANENNKMFMMARHWKIEKFCNLISAHIFW